MTPGEIGWRIRSTLRDAYDMFCIKSGLLPARNHFSSASTLADFQPVFSVLPENFGNRSGESKSFLDADADNRLRRKANEILENRLSFFDLQGQFMGDPVDWHSDHSAGKRAQLRLSHRIDYRDFATVGDCKLVWEPNRHHQFVVLAQAFHITGDIAYAEKVCGLFDSWLDANPFGYGMNWRSPLELGIRLINWVWTVDLIRSANVMSPELWQKLRYTAYLMCRDISRKYSQGSSSNNHLIGEAAGVFIAASYFVDLPEASDLRSRSRNILEREILAQSYPDGCTREQALGYQFFVIQFLTLCALVGTRTGNPLSSAYLNRLRQQYLFVSLLAEGGSDLPIFGDKDDGYVLDFGVPVTDSDMTIATGACLFRDSELAGRVRQWPSVLGWLFDQETITRTRGLVSAQARILTSHAFRDSGYFLLQCGEKDGADAISLLFDCGEIGFGSIAAHGHADALSFTLRAASKQIFIDTGTYDYFSHPEAREYFRSTCAHNTIEIDGQSQSGSSGPFMWVYKAAASCLEFHSHSSGPSVVGMHNGYGRLREPVDVRRRITLDPANRTLRIVDSLSANAVHSARCFFHVDAAVEVKVHNGREFALNHTGTRLVLVVDEKLDVLQCKAKEGDMIGWMSRNYHVLTPSTTIVGETTFNREIELTHEIRLPE
ncbi:MAG: alginate lyase family protein [Woeseiaceae bacterium]